MTTKPEPSYADLVRENENLRLQLSVIGGQLERLREDAARLREEAIAHRRTIAYWRQKAQDLADQPETDVEGV